MSRPNILYIMSDDHAANAISCYGSRLAEIAPTPNIDRIAREGIRLESCFCTNSICTPSRGAILTGQYSHRNGIYTLMDELPPGRDHVAKQLQRAGYRTAIAGKWHLQREPTGFDYYNVLPGQGSYHNPRLKEKGKPWKDRGEGGEIRSGYCTDVITDICLEWLQKREKDKPFFLLCHHKAPHGLWEYPSRHARLFEGQQIPEPESLWEDKAHRSPGSRDFGAGMEQLAGRMADPRHPTGPLNTAGLSGEEVIRVTYQKYLKEYLRCVRAIDENVGRMLDYVEKAGLKENTVVIYTSDQGQFLGEHDYYDKRWMFEESLRMPFLARYPAEIPPGSVNSDLVINTDFAPLFLDYAGRESPAEMQGRSFRSNLAGASPRDWRTAFYYRYWMHMAHMSNPAHYGIRTRAHKLIFFYGLPLDAAGALPEPTPPGLELYDLEKDPFELHNVAEDPAYAEVLRDLKSRLLALKEELGDGDEGYPELMERRSEFF